MTKKKIIILITAIVLTIAATTIILNAAGLKDSDFIGIDKAKEIITPKYPDAQIYKVELDSDKGVYEYEIKFYVDSQKYEIDIDALTGDITKTKESKAKSKSSSIDFDNILTIDEIIDIILNDIGSKKDDIAYYEYEFERDDGIIECEVELIINDTKYEYELNASDGTILDIEIKYYVN